MEDFVIKRFIKGAIILVLSGLIIGVGRGVSDTIHLLKQPSNVYNYLSIYVPIGIDDLSNASFQTISGHTNHFRYELSNGEIGGGTIFLIEGEDKQVAEDISESVGCSLKLFQIGVQRLPISKITFSLTAESTASVKVYLVNDYGYILEIPEDGQAVIHELDRTDTSYEIEIPRLYATNSTDQWTYASFFSLVIVLEDGTPFTLSETKLYIPLQRTSYDETDTLIQ